LAKPGGNLTGVSVNAGMEIWGKRFQVLKELLPSAPVVGWLGARAVWDGPLTEPIREAGARLGISVTGMLTEASIPPEYQRVFAAATRDRPDVIAVRDGEDEFRHRQLIVELAEKSRLPAMYPYREYAEVGGLVAYATDLTEFGRRLAASAGQILNGAKPGDIPIYQATKFELVVNLKTAKGLGLTVPQSLLARADEVIE
jgi:putative ABC transport system substrate-binding protein